MRCLLAPPMLLLLLLAVAPCLAFVWNQGIPPRIQWMTNAGYCGECSTVASGLKWGQYLSQYDIRDVATGSQFLWYLPGENDIPTAIHLRLNYSIYPNTCDPKDPKTKPCSHQYLAWMKSMARRGYAVTFVVYMNEWQFHGNPDPDAGFPDYDHIVSLYEWESKYDDDEYHEDDLLTFSDHGVWDLEKKKVPITYLFQYNLSDFQASRRQANAHDGNIYSIASDCSTGNFGVAHLGPADPSGVLLPTTIQTDVNYETPEIVDKSQKRPSPMPLQLNVTVSAVEQGVAYKAYIYGNNTKVPVKDFNALAAAADAIVPFTGDGSGAFTFERQVVSSDMVFVRVVRADAP